MAFNFIEQNMGPEITAIFTDGGILVREVDIWKYERDGKSSIALEPEMAVKGAEGYGLGIEIWKGGE